MESLPNFYMEEITDADLDEIFGPMEVEEQTLEATPETEVSRVRFACLNEQQLGEIEEGRVEKTTESCVGFVFLKESLFLADVCGIFISVTGVVLVVVGNTQVDGMPTKLLVLSIVIPLTASFVSAPEVVFMRYLTGLKNVKAYISTTVRMFVIPFTLILDYFFLQKVPNSFHLAGVVLVMVGIVFVSAHTWRKERQKERRVELLQTLQFDPD
ncbi:hypothetical protein Bbelb_216640 [Branchiostoma belcheri]|nr:hypothetical protein Bbelb_216640 [Branchiostoma belcheri]